jgi:hypothetical protein
MAKLGIELNGNKTAFAPGEPVEGRIEWQSDVNPAALELSLLWYTSGKGTRDIGICGTHRVEHPGSLGSDTFASLPPALQLLRQMISLIWTWATSTPGTRPSDRKSSCPHGKGITLPP